METKSALITGGAGFIGSHLADLLLTKKFRVTIADNLSRGSWDNIAHIKSRIHFLHVDLRLEQSALRATKNQNVVFNLAALNTGIDYDTGNTQKMFEENMLLQMLPLRAAAANHVGTFIQVSSASIYSRKIMESDKPIKETDDHGAPEPSKIGYALAKRMGENLARWYAASGAIKTVIARFINVYGPRDHFDSLGHFIPVVVKKYHTAKNQIEVFGSGKQKRSFLHVYDAANALWLLAEKGINGETYNIDPQDEYPIREIVRSVGQIMGKKDVSVYFNIKRPEGSKRRMLDNTKIRLLGWKPQHRLNNTLPKVIDDIVSRLSRAGV